MNWYHPASGRGPGQGRDRERQGIEAAQAVGAAEGHEIGGEADGRGGDRPRPGRPPRVPGLSALRGTRIPRAPQEPLAPDISVNGGSPRMGQMAVNGGAGR